MDITKTKLDGVLQVRPDIFKDIRGSFTESYNRDTYFKKGIKIDFVVDDYSHSLKNVLRGLHGDKKTWKLVDCAQGEIYLVVLNIIENSKEYGQWESFLLTDKNRWQVLIPPKFANGYLALTETATLHYKQSEYYHPGKQFAISYKDPRFKIKWPVKKPILSTRDNGDF